MKILINGTDYAAALDAARSLTIVRKLNEPSICQLSLVLPSSGSLLAPQRYQQLRVVGDDGRVYFTGYIAASPMPEYAGAGLTGPRYRTVIQALSDELLLDSLLMPSSTTASGESTSSVISALVERTGSSALTVSGSTQAAAVGQLMPAKGATWSRLAREAATEARSSYHALDGQVAVSAVQSTVHAFREDDGTLDFSSLAFTSSVERGLANDVTVCGEHEPAAYVTEYFYGDGIASDFYLSETPYKTPASKTTAIRELFEEANIDTRYWSAPSASQYMSIGAAGLTMNGGSGIDGGTVLSWIDPVEMGGSMLLEASGLTLSPGSTGVVAGIYVGLTTQNCCIAGFQVTSAQGTGAVTIQPMIAGSASGIAVSVSSSNMYTLRTRIYAPEVERQRAIYRSFGDDGEISFGGDLINSPARVQMEVEAIVNGVGSMPVTVYDGTLASLTESATIVAASSINLMGTLRAFRLTRTGAEWITRTPAGGSARICRTGTMAEVAECSLASSGKLTFYTGYAPVAGERITVSYRSISRAVGRSINTASQTALAAAGNPSEAAWIGSVTNPTARSSADCYNAARAIQQAAAGTAALWSGRYKATNLAFSTDVWPGDGLSLISATANLDANVVVREIKLSYRASVPDVVEYEVSFANDWADDLAIQTSSTVPADTQLPVAADATALANLTALTVTALSGPTVTIDAGQDPPAGGGFEIRLRDHVFMAGEDADLVMRTTVRNMTFSRLSENDRFFIRMFDGSTPPNYSQFSAALFINLPLSA
jgi:hypothetical protein